MTILKAFFYIAQDARRAKNLMAHNNIQASDPIPLERPEGGRPWMLEVQVAAGASSNRYQSPVLTDRAVTIIRQFNGITDQAQP